LLLMAHRRIRLDEIVAPPNIPGDHSVGDNSGPDSTSQTSSTPAMGRVTFLKMRPSDAKSATIKAYANEIIVAVRDLVKMNPMAQEHIHEWYVHSLICDEQHFYHIHTWPYVTHMYNILLLLFGQGLAHGFQ
jgi:hypothetical protein